MNQQEFRQLIDKYLAGNASVEEEQLLLNFFDSFQSDAEWDNDVFGAKQQLEDKMLSRLQNAVAQSNNKKRKIFSIPVLKHVAAAAIFLAAASTIMYCIMHRQQQNQVAVNKPAVTHDVNPGGNKATLTLSNGATYVLDSAKNGILTQNGKISIKKEKDGQIVYAADGVKSTTADENMYNTMTTKAGGQYQVLLADGTKVWLNSESSIKYPTAFKGSQRIVELTGEAYFEVAKNAAMPFIVKVNDMQVKVLGTHFNIMAYNDEAAVKTTLLEGSVKLSIGQASNVLKPGQQGMVNKNGQIKVVDVDTDLAIAWKNGYFEFDRSNIQEIMAQLSRWYDTKVTYEGKIPDDEFVGRIERGVKLSQVLRILELSHVHFKIENKNIIVTP
ncbi:FecR domain-containing protein [Mucilaginibacter sp. BJC16-A38]|uniref:FecR family protein n=1 Tax=Mucilaginibacter phenanthrenivorans TaxID=1234842 RepID=UPI002157FEB9|nr:FecR family protein [Mucilaginibacter phenanthrenivorans]MCR8558358.1 FecR domain-containing protein [Mucilaginibacter phenanthrenivorans]